MSRLVAFLITLWAGSLWTICGLVAPTLFTVLDDRHVAGQLAARFFLAATVIGVIVGAVLIGLSLARKAGVNVAVPGRGLILTTAGFPLTSQLILGPLMDQARASGDMARFGMLHAVAGACFVVACVGAFMLVWQLNRPAE